MKEKSQTAKKEEEVLDFWQENKIFEKSLEKNKDSEFIFYDGPPFATGLPHYGSLLSSIVKDVIPRYKTMRGYNVRRRWGWDCHGLPIESLVEKNLKLKTKKEIEDIGVEKFNQTCRENVLTFVDAWKKYVNRIARWVDFDNSYKTMDFTYNESVWWSLKTIWNKGLLYEGKKVLMYCPHCETPLSKAEIAMDNSYQDVEEESVVVKFKLVNPEKADLPPDTHILSWTTTPWTLPSNVALAVGPDVQYCLVKKENNHYVIAKKLIEQHFSDDYSVEKDVKAGDLVGLEYLPLFKLEDVVKTGKKAHYVAEADFVTTDEGTGIVHTAVIYGEDDYNLGLKLDLPMVPVLDQSGHFNQSAPDLIRGKYFKKAEKEIIEYLKKNNLLFNSFLYKHSYPHCYRCGTALLYNAISSWFININKIKDRIIELNEKMNWVPEHLKHGRFLKILESAPDWNISRNRYWATPLPIWKCGKCGEIELLGSLDEVKKKTQGTNNYFIMRHGESESNLKGIVSRNVDDIDPLTEHGVKQVEDIVRDLKKEEINLIVASPLIRTRQTAEMVARGLGIEVDDIVFDERLIEIQTAEEFEGKTWKEHSSHFNSGVEKLTKSVKGGESLMEVKRRATPVLYDLDEKYEDKNILIVGHGGVLEMLWIGVQGADVERAVKLVSGELSFIYQNAKFSKLDFAPIPHNNDFEVDLHRPYIDHIHFDCKCGAEMERIPEVLDCWFESGAMPFAEYHYPFENEEIFEKRSPGDFVSEYIAQTRTWFYYMHAISVILFDQPSFVNVLTTGNILASDGSKMSKSKGNYSDPLEIIDMYGADALRYYLMSGVVMQAEDMSFFDDGVKEAHNKVVNTLRNVNYFYSTFSEKVGNSLESKNILDKWILSRLVGLENQVTDGFEKYDTIRANRPIRDFINDLSTWYLRRSRDRFKGEDEVDRKSAISTMTFVLQQLSKLIAPTMPFLAEDTYRVSGGELESVHLEDWTDSSKWNISVDSELINQMKEVRNIVSMTLDARNNLAIKVRQPLATLKIKNRTLEGINQMIDLIKDEINVKKVVFDETIENEVWLDSELTEELLNEGSMREFVRQVQDMRKKQNLSPTDVISVAVDTDDRGRKLLNDFEEQIKKTVSISNISFESNEGVETKINNIVFVITIKK